MLPGYNIAIQSVRIFEHSLNDVGMDMGEMGSDDPVFTQDSSSIEAYKIARTSFKNNDWGDVKRACAYTTTPKISGSS